MYNEDYQVILIKFLSSSFKNSVINVGENWTLQMLIPQHLVLVLKLSPIYTVSLNMVFSIPQNQCYLGTSCSMKSVKKVLRLLCRAVGIVRGRGIQSPHQILAVRIEVNPCLSKGLELLKYGFCNKLFRKDEPLTS